MKEQEKFDPTNPAQQERAKKRRFKKPFEFIVAMPDKNKVAGLVLPDGTPPKMELKIGKFKVETVGDLATFDRMLRDGIFFPLPELSIQVLNIIFDVLGLVENSEKGGKG